MRCQLQKYNKMTHKKGMAVSHTILPYQFILR